MTVALSVEPALFEAVKDHLLGHDEQVAFLLADFDESRALFTIKQWRPMPEEAFEFQSPYHVTLQDELRPELIKWAWDEDACLLEVHSHGTQGTACFSPSDLHGLAEWVPHVRWRLAGKPYAALVTAGDSFDALAWIDDESTEPNQLGELVVGDSACPATGHTLRWLARGRTLDVD